MNAHEACQTLSHWVTGECKTRVASGAKLGKYIYLQTLLGMALLNMAINDLASLNISLLLNIS